MFRLVLLSAAACLVLASLPALAVEPPCLVEAQAPSAEASCGVGVGGPVPVGLAPHAMAGPDRGVFACLAVELAPGALPVCAVATRGAGTCVVLVAGGPQPLSTTCLA